MDIILFHHISEKELLLQLEHPAIILELTFQHHLEQIFIQSILGTIIFTGFYGADGYTIIEETPNITIIYAHVSPNFLVIKNQKVLKGQKIGEVGPLYIDSLENTKYFDKNGKKTNGATTGPHLHITIKKDGKAVNPLEIL